MENTILNIRDMNIAKALFVLDRFKICNEIRAIRRQIGVSKIDGGVPLYTHTLKEMFSHRLLTWIHEDRIYGGQIEFSEFAIDEHKPMIYWVLGLKITIKEIRMLHVPSTYFIEVFEDRDVGLFIDEDPKYFILDNMLCHSTNKFNRENV